MDKLIFMFYIFAAVTIPIIGARMSRPRKGLAWSLGVMAAVVALYTFLVLRVAVRHITLN